jgi:hypothetical protein
VNASGRFRGGKVLDIEGKRPSGAKQNDGQEKHAQTLDLPSGNKKFLADQ